MEDIVDSLAFAGVTIHNSMVARMPFRPAVAVKGKDFEDLGSTSWQEPRPVSQSTTKATPFERSHLTLSSMKQKAMMN
jgi:hypothetical protein